MHTQGENIIGKMLMLEGQSNFMNVMAVIVTTTNWLRIHTVQKMLLIYVENMYGLIVSWSQT